MQGKNVIFNGLLNVYEAIVSKLVEMYKDYLLELK